MALRIWISCTCRNDALRRTDFNSMILLTKMHQKTLDKSKLWDIIQDNWFLLVQHIKVNKD